MFKQEIISKLRSHKPGNRARVMRLIRNNILDNNKEDEVSEIILDIVSVSIKEELPLLLASKRIIKYISKLLQLDLTPYPDGEKHSSGIQMIDYLGEYIRPQVRECIKRDGSIDYQTILISINKDLDIVVNEVESYKFIMDPTDGPKTWSGFYMDIDDKYSIEFVKKASRYNLQHLYSYKRIPEVYDAINKLQQTPYKINKWVLDVANNGHIFIPPTIDDEDKRKALRSIARMKKKARQTNSLQKLEESDWFADQSIIVSDWSKRKAWNETLKRATTWQDEILHFTYTLDTRSRMYAIQPYLNPQDSDFAKSLLLFNEPQPLDHQVLAVVTANHAGQDKLSFEDRIKWVDDNINDIIAIGEDPSTTDFILKWEIEQESKSKWQFLACCREWYNIYLWTEAGNTMESYKTSIVAALDASCSALQIATVISRDETLAPYVNLVKTDKPGDIYKKSGEELQEAISKLDDISIGLQQVLDHESVRKVAKRPQMVADYSGTMKGMMDMTYKERVKNKIPAANKKDCNMIGKLLFNITNGESRGSTKIKNFLRSGVNFHSQGAVIKWKTIDDFTCFQVADKSSERVVQGSIGGINVNLKYYIYNDIKNTQKHQNLICPNVTHSIDASIVRYLVNRLPNEVPLAMVHDSYGTSSNYAHLLLPIILEAFTVVGDRDWYENMVSEMFNHHRTLPSPGKLTINNIMESQYAIC